MNPTIKNIVAVVAGIFIGAIVNMGLILVSGSIIPPPDGADVTTTEGLKASMHLFEARHYLFPFLAHALGTLVGALLAARIAASHKKIFALSIGGLFFIGGAINAFTLPAPTWFIAVDLIVAYFPMAMIGYLITGRSTK
jgi:hypothetical protein